MERYKYIKVIGEGSFGSVSQAINKLTGEVVAVKKIKRKYYSSDECMKLKEIQALRKMKHPNIVNLKEAILENDVLFYVFEYMESNLHELIKARGCDSCPLQESEIKNLCFQVLLGLAHMHQKGYIHRDLKPENLLVTQDNTIIKIADLGLARDTTSQLLYTDIVGTLWYRAPEMVFRSRFYDFKVDMWAIGVIMAEMFTGRGPVLPGKNEEDQMHRMCQFIGTPSHGAWPEGYHLANCVKYRFPQFEKVEDLSIPNASVEAVSLIKSLCSWDPRDRPSANEALQHPFFRGCLWFPKSIRSGPVVKTLGPPPGFESKYNPEATDRGTNMQRMLAC